MAVLISKDEKEVTNQCVLFVCVCLTTNCSKFDHSDSDGDDGDRRNFSSRTGNKFSARSSRDRDSDEEPDSNLVLRKGRNSLSGSMRRPPPPREARPTSRAMDGSDDEPERDSDRRQELVRNSRDSDKDFREFPRESSFKPKSITRGKQNGSDREQASEVPRNSSWVENWKSSQADDYERENSTSRSGAKWNVAKPQEKEVVSSKAAVDRDSPPRERPRAAPSARATSYAAAGYLPDKADEDDAYSDRSRRTTESDYADDRDIKKQTSFSEFAEEAERSGKVLGRKSGRYDGDGDGSDGSDGRLDKYGVPSAGGAARPAVPYVMKAHARGSLTERVQCVVVRDRSSVQSKLYPTYELHLEDPPKLLIVAMKMNLNRTSNYHLFDMTRGQAGSRLSKKSGNYLGKLRAKNVNRTEYVLATQSSEREEIAGVLFDRLGIINQLKEGSQPRKMTVVVPHLDSSKTPIPNRVRENGEGSLSEILRSATIGNRVLTFETKDPVFENGNYRLNFHGRVSVPSVKNFQLVPPDNIDNVVCQFGKVAEDRFNLDFKAPLNALQAFSFALCQFNL